MAEQELAMPQGTDMAAAGVGDLTATDNGSGNGLTEKSEGAAAKVADKALKVSDFMAQPAMQRAIPAIIALAILVVSLVIYSVFTGSSHRPLYENLSEEDRSAVYAALQEAGIDARIQQSSGMITVSDEDYHRAKMMLASQGLPQGATTGGFEMIRGEQSLGTSQFMEQMRYRLAIEEELAASISTINSIKKARVHLAIPKQSVFIRDREKPKASVVVWPHGGRVVSDSQVQAIVNMVASSVPFMDAESVSVVDRYGNLLHSSTNSPEMKMSNEKMRYRRSLEEMYRSRIVALLTPFMGQENIHVEVNAEVDFTTVESMSESFPGQNVTRSEQLSERRNASKEAVGIPGAMSNQAPVEGELVASGQGEGKSDQVKDEQSVAVNHNSTRNYEVDRTIRHEKKLAGHLTKLTVAMVLDAPKPAEGEEAKPQKSVEELETLIKGAIGFNEARGDSVVVMSTAFEELPQAEEIPLWKDPDMQSIARQMLVVIAFILLVLFVFRPLIRNVVNPGTMVSGQQVAIGPDGQPIAIGEDGLPHDENMMREGETLEEMKQRLRPKKKSSISADMLDTANTYDDKVALVRMLVSEDSRRVANVMRGWLKRDIG
jgi:flagellar M-ring protein FliF